MELQRMHWKRSEFVRSSVVLSVSAIKSGSFNLIFEIELLVSSSRGHTRSFLNSCAVFHIGPDLTILTVISWARKVEH